MSVPGSGRRAVFREEALRGYAESRRRSEPLRDVSARLVRSLWICAAVLTSGLIAVGTCVAVMLT